MESRKETRALSQIDADVLVVGIFQDEVVTDALKQLDEGLPEQLVTLLADEAKRESFTGKPGQSLTMPSLGAIAARKLVLRGLGKTKDLTSVRKAAASCRRATTSSETVALDLRTAGDGAKVQAALEGWLLGGYKFTKYKTKDDDKKESKTKTVLIVDRDIADDSFQTHSTRASTIADATNFARDLIAEPAAFMTPTRLAEAALTLSDSGITVQIIDRDEAEKLGMGSFLGVARGAAEPPKFIIMRYAHGDAKKTVALAGKGITFDSGGLSIKTAQGMETMKYDMSGAAVVIATMKAISTLKPEVNITAVAAATENMPSGTALHPGDVLTAMNGKTIEVNNTDAEGRLVLADALCYLSRESPTEIIDLATLTGAAVTALGRAAAALMSNNDDLTARLTAAGEAAGERYWRLPLYDDYKDALKSDIADLKNAGARGEAGTAAAAMFLQEFISKDTPWAHLDIAGPAWLDKDKEENNKGGTAFGVRTLLYYLLNQP